MQRQHPQRVRKRLPQLLRIQQRRDLSIGKDRLIGIAKNLRKYSQ
jgi:hypothetical protein